MVAVIAVIAKVVVIAVIAVIAAVVVATCDMCVQHQNISVDACPRAGEDEVERQPVAHLEADRCPKRTRAAPHACMHEQTSWQERQ